MDISALLEEAQRHEEDQAWTEALETYRQALALDPTNAQIHNSLGIVYEKLGQIEQAVHHYQSALQLAPDAAYVHYNLGTLYKEQGQADEAQAEFERFLSLIDDPKEIAETKALLTEVSGLSFEKCRRCGCISTLESFFKSTPIGQLCPRCYAQFWPKRLAGSFGILGISFLILAVLAYSLLPPFHYILINVLLVLILNFLLIIPHELCHAVVAWLTGGKVFEIRLGMGPTIWEKDIGSLLLSFGKYPFLGLCLAAFPTRAYIRGRLFLLISAGMLFNLFMLLLFAPSYVGSRFDAMYAFREAFVIANVWQLFLSLFPRKVGLGGVDTGVDGLKLLRILLGKLSADIVHLTYFAYEGLYAMKRKAYDRVIEVCEDVLALYPDRAFLFNDVKALALLNLDQHVEALALFQELLMHLETSQPIERLEIMDTNRALTKAVLLNNVAYTTLLNSPGPEALKQAYKHAQQAFRMAPWLVFTQGTLGAVLVEMGRVEEGLKHLLGAAEYHEDAKSKATVLAHAAVGHQRLGNAEKAAALLQEAKALDASAYMVKKAQAELTMSIGAT
jgi:tetratricopeptide (TPR) repeat protein